MVEIKHRKSSIQNPFRRDNSRGLGLPTHYGKQGSFHTHNGGHSPLKRLRNICVFMVVGGLALYTFLGSSSSSESPSRIFDDLPKAANDGGDVDPYEQQQQQRRKGVLRSRSRDSKQDNSYKKRQPSDSVENAVDSNEGNNNNHNNYDNPDHSHHHHHGENPNSHEEKEEEEEEGHVRGDGSKNGHVDSKSLDAEHDKNHLEHAKQVAPDPMSADSEENKNNRGGMGNRAHHDTQQQDKESAEEKTGMDSHEQQDKDSLGHGDKSHDEGRKGSEETKDIKHSKDQKEEVGDKEIKDGLDATTTKNDNENESKTDHLGFVVPPVDSNLSETTTPDMKTAPTTTTNVSQTTTLLSNNVTDAASATNKTPLILGDATIVQNTTTGKLTSLLKSNDTATSEKKEGDEDHALEIVGDTSLEVVVSNETSKKSEQPLTLHGPDEEPADANFQPLHKEGEEEEAADANFQPLHKNTETDGKDSTGSTAPKKKIEDWKEAENEMLEPIYNKEGEKSPDDEDNNESGAGKEKEAGLDTESEAKEHVNLDETLAKAS